jgi:hypothetical protein
MPYFDVRVAGDAIVSAILRVEADSIEAAKKAAIAKADAEEETIQWSVDYLHESPEVYSIHEVKKL